jgi:hypothetical protein
MVRRSHVLQALNQIRVNYGLCGRVGACGEDLDVAKGEAGVRNQIYLQPSDDKWREAWSVTEALITEMRGKVVAHGAEFFVVGLSNSIQVHPDAAIRRRFMMSINAPDLFYPDRRLNEFAEQEGIHFLALAPILADEAERTHKYFHGFKNTGLGKGHWNADGHRLAGETIASWLSKQLEIDASAPSSVASNNGPPVQ